MDQINEHKSRKGLWITLAVIVVLAIVLIIIFSKGGSDNTNTNSNSQQNAVVDSQLTADENTLLSGDTLSDNDSVDIGDLVE